MQRLASSSLAALARSPSLALVGSALAVIVALLAVVVLAPEALAQAGDIYAKTKSGFDWGRAAVRVLCACLFLGGAALFVVSRFGWQSALVMLIALLGWAVS